VALGYATLRGGFQCTLDHRIYLPRCWSEQRDRSHEAGVPDEMVHQPKWNLALAMLERVQANGVRFAWLTFDEGFGGNVQFLEALDRMGQTYVAEVPRNLHGWLIEPTVLQKDHHADSRPIGRPPRYPRLAVNSAPPRRIDRLCRHSYPVRDQPWQDYHVKQAAKGPVVWQAKAARFRVNLAYEQDGRRRGWGMNLPSSPRWLIMARNPLTGELKYFLSNASAGVPIERLLHVAFSRWHIERCFQDEKGQLGLDQFECRRYVAVQRHLILTAISHLFLARTRLKLIAEGRAAGEKSPDGPPTASCRGCGDRSYVAAMLCSA
jgi:SRSO17 transposase